MGSIRLPRSSLGDYGNGVHLHEIVRVRQPRDECHRDGGRVGGLAPDALEALDAVTLVDRPTGFNAALELGKTALKRLPDMPNKRLVFLGDGQRTSLPAGGLAQSLSGEGAPSDVQIVSLAPHAPENAWIAEWHAVDGAGACGFTG